MSLEEYDKLVYETDQLERSTGIKSYDISLTNQLCSLVDSSDSQPVLPVFLPWSYRKVLQQVSHASVTVYRFTELWGRIREELRFFLGNAEEIKGARKYEYSLLHAADTLHAMCGPGFCCEEEKLSAVAALVKSRLDDWEEQPADAFSAAVRALCEAALQDYDKQKKG